MRRTIGHVAGMLKPGGAVPDGGHRLDAMAARDAITARDRISTAWRRLRSCTTRQRMRRHLMQGPSCQQDDPVTQGKIRLHRLPFFVR
jgi:hypothetical protein